MSQRWKGRPAGESAQLIVQSLRLASLLRLKKVACSSVRCVGRLPVVHAQGDVALGPLFAVRSRTSRCEFGASRGGRLRIGREGFINQGASVVATERIEIGDHCLIGDLVAIYDSNFHALDSSDPAASSPVIIGDNVWIGRNAIVLPGSRIGNNSVVAAASVVRGVIPANSLVAGNPAVIIRSLDTEPGWYRT